MGNSNFSDTCHLHRGYTVPFLLMTILLLPATSFAQTSIHPCEEVSFRQQAELRVQQMYVAYYGRPSDPEGLDFWADQITSHCETQFQEGETIPDSFDPWPVNLINNFGTSEEYNDRFSALSQENLIDLLYQQIFNRDDVDLAGKQFYLDKLNGTNISGNNPDYSFSTLAQIALDIANGARGGDLLTLDNKIEVAMDFTGAIRGSMRVYDDLLIPYAVDWLKEVDASDSSVSASELGLYRLARMMNDTGVATCSDETGAMVDCPVSALPGQDGDYGRDQAFADVTDGAAGFSFTKLDANGNPLSSDALDWVCILDNATGAVWENKPDDNGLRDKDWTYTWFGNSVAAGATVGIQALGNCPDSNSCDTQTYVTSVNALNLCGRTDWRLPTPQELIGLVHYGDTAAPLIDPNYFKDMDAGTALPFWTSSLDNSGGATIDQAWSLSFETGTLTSSPMSTPGPVRLISSPELPVFDNSDASTTDNFTALTWTHCSVASNGTDCGGDSDRMTWSAALDLASRSTIESQSDWRLPSLKELLSLIDYSAMPMLDATAFLPAETLQEPLNYWTSTPAIGATNSAWVVNLSTGEIQQQAMTDTAYVRLVRGGKVPVTVPADDDEPEDCQPDGTGCFAETQAGSFVSLEDEMGGLINQTIRLLVGDAYVYSSPSPTHESHWGCDQNQWDVGRQWSTPTDPCNTNGSLANRTYVLRLPVVDGFVRSPSIAIEHGLAGDDHRQWIYALADQPYDLAQPKPANVTACERQNPASAGNFNTATCPLFNEAASWTGTRNMYLMFRPGGPNADSCNTDYRCRAYIDAW